MNRGTNKYFDRFEKMGIPRELWVKLRKIVILYRVKPKNIKVTDISHDKKT
jgi:hypothetical protein